MTDLEITRLCAEAMGLQLNAPGLPMAYRGTDWHDYKGDAHETWIRYDPLNHDAQCFALIKRFGLHVIAEGGMGVWHVAWDAEFPGAKNKNLNRAICECVAKMQAAK